MKQRVYRLIGVVVVILIIAVGSLLLGSGCPIRFVTGIPCAGCGMTRAWYWLLHGDLLQAFRYHPLFWTVPVVGVGWLYQDQFSQRTIKIACFLICLLYVLVYVIRLWGWRDPILSIDIKAGIVVRSIRKIVEVLGRNNR